MNATLVNRPLVATIALALLLISGCSNSPATTSGGNRTLIVEQEFVYDTLDPARGVDPVPVLVDKTVYDTLMTVNARDLSKPYPSLATSFNGSPDGKTFTFHLRQGVKFASGNPFTSADVVWSLTRLANIKGLPAIVMTGLTASAPDPSTVVITSNTPNPAVPIIMTQSNAGILDSKLVQQHGGTTDATDKAEDYLNTSAAATGPYTTDSVDRTSQVVLKANPNYWGPKPVYSTVILRNVPAATQQLDIQDGQAQVAINISTQDAPSLDTSKVNVIAAPTADQYFVALNADPKVSKLSADANFREAVRYGLDYTGLVALAGKGAVQECGFVPQGLLGALPASECTKRDLTRAKAALAKVGVANPTIVLDYSTDYAQDGLLEQPFVTKIQSDLKEVGITVTLLGTPASINNPKAQSGKVAMWATWNAADYPDPSDFLNETPGAPSYAHDMNWAAGMDTSLDALVTAASSATQPAAESSAYQALQRAMNDKGYFDFILQPGRILVTAKSVKADLNPFTYIDLGLAS
jgi:peptide/nickel transport system substrate-binding protein